jgi:hypothetical protein
MSTRGIIPSRVRAVPSMFWLAMVMTWMAVSCTFNLAYTACACSEIEDQEGQRSCWIHKAINLTSVVMGLTGMVLSLGFMLPQTSRNAVKVGADSVVAASRASFGVLPLSVGLVFAAAVFTGSAWPLILLLVCAGPFLNADMVTKVLSNKLIPRALERHVIWVLLAAATVALLGLMRRMYFLVAAVSAVGFIMWGLYWRMVMQPAAAFKTASVSSVPDLTAKFIPPPTLDDLGF